MATVASNHQSFYTGKRERISCHAITSPIEIKMRNRETESTLGENKKLQGPSFNRNPQKGKLRMVAKTTNSTEKHLNSLNSYLVKLRNDGEQPSSKIFNQRTESIGENDRAKVDNGLRSLENYLDKVKDGESEKYVKKDLPASVNTSTKKDQGSGKERSFENYTDLKIEVSEGKESAEEASDFYLIGVLASINIAVFLFEIATPVKNTSFELFSLPLLYGAKINNLILIGEWWRLVTPMFLHSGLFHIALGSWVLFTFGHQVSRQYGSFTFLLIYILGGISGNLISFLHTPDPTVGGTGPVFAIIGAWLIYQVQNKDVILRDDSSERMFQNAIIATALSFVLSNFGPIDDWAHFASAFTGIAYGFVTCPTLQMKDASQETGREERIALVRRFADPCKSLMYFSLFLLMLSSLLFVIEPPIDL